MDRELLFDELVLLALPYFLASLVLLITILFAWAIYSPARRWASNRLSVGDNLIAGTISIIIISAGVYAIVNLLGIEISIVTGAILTCVAIVSTATAFSLEKIIRDYFAGLKISSANRFKRGDMVTLAGVTGVVQEVNAFNVILKTASDSIVTISNSLVADDSIIVNHTAFGHYQLSIKFPLIGDFDRCHAKAMILLEAEKDDLIEDNNLIHCWFDSIGDQPVETYELIFFLDRENIQHWEAVRDRLHIAVSDRLNDTKIKVATNE